MKYAEVSVNTPAVQRQTFSYSIPSGLNVDVGQGVYVPFGQKTVQGVVLELTDIPAFEPTRDITGIIDSIPLLSEQSVILAKWLSNYYLSPIFDAVALMLPPGFERRVYTSISSTHQKYDPKLLNETQFNLLELLEQQGKVYTSEIEKILGKNRTSSTISQLIDLGLIERMYELEPVRVKPKTTQYIRLSIDRDKALGIAQKIFRKSPKQASLLKLLSEEPDQLSFSEVKHKVACDTSTIRTLEKKGWVKIELVEMRRTPLSHYNIQLSVPLNLTSTQEDAFRPIKVALQQTAKITKPSVFLLHGVTASGKTEIYLQVLAEAIKLGKKGIVLVPEIALTPQTIERFSSRFPGKVAVLHSQLSLGEQFDEWQRIRNNEVDVVVGPRSALFAPQPNLGLIIIDEEHEWTYKQHDQSPRYHTRYVAVKLAELTGAVIVLGSATPSIESYYLADKGEYQLLRLPERVVPKENAPLPETKIVDMREELKSGNRSIFSRALTREIKNVLGNKEQAILFLNRRGSATTIQCRNCGFVIKCKRCDIPLTYHVDSDSLICHQCNHKTNPPQVCPNCLSRRIRYLGIGTEKVEKEIKSLFPEARLLRWDRDVTQRKYSHEDILNKFRNHEADILVGTQMVAKGLDLPLVTLVGIVLADTSLNMPDFRAGERTFQLLSQVAGRAGRGQFGGRVIIQTYYPKHYAVTSAAQHDYKAFYEREIEFRRQLKEPPFTQLASLTYIHTNDRRCQDEVEKMAKRLTEERDTRGISDLSLIGPAPAFIHRVRGRYHWQIILRGSNLSDFLINISFPQGWTIDIDPVGL